MSKEDLSIDGPGSPISLKKFLENNGSAKPFTLLVDGTGFGIAKDDEECIYITPEGCSQQAFYYKEKKFDNRTIPAYLYRYLSYMFIDDAKWYESDQELVEDFNKGLITENSDNYKTVLSLIKWCEQNKESAQVIGLIQLIGGSLNIARKEGCGIKLYIEHPETSLHPKRQAKFVSMLTKIQEEYGLKPGTI